MKNVMEIDGYKALIALILRQTSFAVNFLT